VTEIHHNGNNAGRKSGNPGHRHGILEFYLLEKLRAKIPAKVLKKVESNSGKKTSLGLAAPSWARYVMNSCMTRFVRFAMYVLDVKPCATDEETAMKGIEAMEEFFRSIGMPTNLKELGVEPSEDDIKLLANNCAIATGGKIGSAKVLREEDMANIFRMAAL
jgi:alcohol dehydrogenase class IV